MKKRLLLFTLIAISAAGFSQNDSRLAEGLSPVATIEKVVMPALDNEQLIQQEMERRGPGIAPRFAENIEVNISPATHGNWERCKNGNWVWRLVIQSSNAKSINLGFTKYKMPEAGTLILYSPDYKKIIGPFTPADNEEHEQLWTPVLPGDAIVIEVQIPEKLKSALELELKYVNHDFLGFGAVASGSCNVDVICDALDGWPQIDDYRDVIRSVAVIGSGGNTYCSGFLVNNARNDCTPYFITARHCGFINANAATMVAYWNFENSYCREVDSANNGNNGNGTLNDFNTGAIYRAGNTNTDFTLLELDDPVSATANAFFAGWSNLPVAPTKAVGIHHPNAEEKRISFENDALMLTNGLQPNPDANFTHVRVVDWDHGTTEQGSSGSPLFDQNKRVVGQLHGGAAACGNDKSDWYGSFAISWTGGGTSSTCLSHWLDPDNTGITTLDGREINDCNIFIEGNPVAVEICSPSNTSFQILASETFDAAVMLSVSTNIPGIGDIIFDENPIAPGSSTQMHLNVGPTVPTGNYTINVTGNDGIATASEYIEITIFETVPDALELSAPADQAISTSIIPRFTWLEDMQETTYELQIATDSNFINIIETTAALDTNFYDNVTLEVLTTYFWRVRGTNLCGTGAWSESFAFTTADIRCDVTGSIDNPVLLPAENTPTSVSIIEISENGQVTDLDVTGLDISHTWVGDLIISIESPSGTTVTIINQPGVPASGFGCPEDNLLVTFDDDATENYETFDNSCNPGNLAISGTFQPYESLKIFNGETAAGTWKLKILDMADGDGGMLNGWNLNICSTIIPDWSVKSIPEVPAFCEGENIEFQITLGVDFDSTGISLSASGNPVGSTVEFSANSILPGEIVAITISGITAIGDYPITFTATDGTHTVNVQITVRIIDLPGNPQLSYPGNGQTGLALQPVLFWSEAEYATEYLVEIAEDPAFTNIVASSLQTGLEYTCPPLNGNQKYYWRVTAKNKCGEAFSQVFDFTTDLVDGIETLSHDEINIFPNPTDRKLHILFGQPPREKVTFELYSSNGQLVQQVESTGFEAEIELDLQHLSNGVYWLRLVSKDAVLSRKIVLQK